MQSWIQRVLNSLVSVAVSGLAAAVVTGLVALSQRADIAFVVGSAFGAFGSVALAGTAAVLAFRRARQTSVSYPYPGFPVRILEKRINYKIDESGVLHFSRTLKLRALVDNVDRYVDKFVWTGGQSDLPTPGEGTLEIRRLGTAGIWTFYDSVLDRNLRKGEEIVITSHWPPLHNWSGASPFVSTASDEPTDTIVFDVMIPAEFRRNERAIVEEMRSIESIYPFGTNDLAFDEKGQLIWSIDAKHYRHYRIRWSWKKGDEVLPMASVVAEGVAE